MITVKALNCSIIIKMAHITEIENKDSVFRQLADSMPVIIWSADGNGYVDYYNQEWYDFTGFPYDKKGDESWLPILHPDDTELCRNTWNESIRTGKPYNIEYRFRDKERPGEYRWFAGRAQPFLNEKGQVVRWYGTCTDINDHKVTENSLRESEQRFRFMSDIMPQQVWTANAEGALDYVNQGTVNYFGKSAETIVGAGWQDFIHPSDLPKIIDAWVHCLKTLDPYQVEFRLKSKSGNYRWHLGRATPFINEEKEVRWFGTNTDIEEHKKNEQHKDEFISMASHELKTPVTSLKGYTQILQHSFSKDESSTEYKLISRMDNQINKLTKLINDLFDVAKMESHDINLEKTTFDFKELVKETIDSVQLSSIRHKIILNSSENILFEGDKLRLEQVITNFLSNAIKYSPDKEEIIVNYHTQQNNIIFSVKDFGIGIEKENVTRLFERFYRVDNNSMKFQGLGLGLYISSKILTAHNGSFWIESEIGNGSTFYFLIPIDDNKQEVIETDNETFYYDRHLRMNYNKLKERLEVDWLGFHNLQTVQKGGLMILDYLVRFNCKKLLNENTNVIGNWSDASDWVAQVLFPKLEKAGLQYVAWVYAPSTFSRMAAHKSVEGKSGSMIQFFANNSEASEWLDKL